MTTGTTVPAGRSITVSAGALAWRPRATLSCLRSRARTGLDEHDQNAPLCTAQLIRIENVLTAPNGGYLSKVSCRATSRLTKPRVR
jgi:hypothetical protein